ncbi:hypothetical protein IEQ34_005674 [Dendrobium chrysotoxum]|uniref:Small auxin up regulated protein n=1 Tax=Dendrobium chrysotoxum TaxID=161865 RepID=A0AAV7H8T4_DENCH|nr:hypothetical protein IEQ34_005674 [Dendrobium chrysotoxum]
MGIRLLIVTQMKQILRRSISRKQAGSVLKVPKGHFPIYVGEEEKRFVVPVSYLNNPLFQNFLDNIEEEFGLDHQVGGLRVPCKEDEFLCLISGQLSL